MALVEAYFDESGTHEGSPFLCVAGYVFEKEKAVALDVQWRKMLKKYGLPHFHMSECAQNKGVYKHLSKQDCDLAAREAIVLIKAYAERGIALSLAKNAWELIPKDGIFSSAYSFMCWQVSNGIKKWANETGFDGRVACFFETGANGWGAARSEINKVLKYPSVARDFRVSSVTFLNKEDSAALQCADLLAWHWFTYNKRQQEGKPPKRADFKSLIELKNIDVHHYDKESIEKWLNWKKETGQ